MTNVFISYARSDQAVARQLEHALVDAGFSTFLDQHPVNGIAAGTDWLDELHRALARAGAVVYISSAASAASAWCQAEFVNAYWSGTVIIPVQLDDTQPPLSQRIQAIRLTDSLNDVSDRVVALLLSQFPFASSSRRISRMANPYPGLRSFHEDEAEMFFGRSEMADEIVRRLVAPLAAPDEFILAISGPSGCGKSSLVGARILPLLRIRPEGIACVGPVEPSAFLGNRIGSLAGHSQLRNMLFRRDSSDRTRSPRRVVLLLDQVERLFTEYGEDDARLLVRELEQLASQDAWFRCLVVFRSDVLNSSAVDATFGRYLLRPVRVPVLQRPELRLAISEPARLAGIRFEEGLVDHILDEVGGGEALPLLAYCLWSLVERAGTDRLISLHLYRESGGVRATLRQQADSALAELTTKGVPSEQVFAALLRLVSITSGQLPSGKTVNSKALAVLDREILDRFVARKLVVKDSIYMADSYQAAHEELLKWPILSRYIERHRIELIVLAALERKAEAFSLGEQRPLEGADLAHARYFADRGLSSENLMVLTDASRVSDRPPFLTRITRPIVLGYGLVFGLFYLVVLLALLAVQGLTFVLKRGMHAGETGLAGSVLVLLLGFLIAAAEVATYVVWVRPKFRLSRFGYYRTDGARCDARRYMKRWLLAPAGVLLTPVHQRSFRESRLTWVDQKTHTELVRIVRDGSRRDAARAPRAVDLRSNQEID